MRIGAEILVRVKNCEGQYSDWCPAKVTAIDGAVFSVTINHPFGLMANIWFDIEREGENWKLQDQTKIREPLPPDIYGNKSVQCSKPGYIDIHGEEHTCPICRGQRLLKAKSKGLKNGNQY